MNTCHMMAAICAIALAASAASAQTSTDQRRAELLRERAAIDAELKGLDAVTASAAGETVTTPNVSAAAGDAVLDQTDIIVTAKALSLTTKVTGQTVTTVTDRAFRNTPATTIADIVRLSPGVAVIQGNGPRDVGVSIRGSNARNSFGARNIQVFEDDANTIVRFQKRMDVSL